MESYVKKRDPTIRDLLMIMSFIGMFVAAIWGADERWNQRDKVEVLEDRISAQIYTFEIAILKEDINYLKDKQQFVKLSIPDKRRLERLQARYKELISTWDELAMTYGVD